MMGFVPLKPTLPLPPVHLERTHLFASEQGEGQMRELMNEGVEKLGRPKPMPDGVYSPTDDEGPALGRGRIRAPATCEKSRRQVPAQ